MVYRSICDRRRGPLEAVRDERLITRSLRRVLSVGASVPTPNDARPRLGAKRFPFFRSQLSQNVRTVLFCCLRREGRCYIEVVTFAFGCDCIRLSTLHDF